MGSRFPILARTLAGLEEILAGELLRLGAIDVRADRRCVHFLGDQRLLYAANIHCRTAVRILKPIHSFPADDEKALYQGVADVDWSQHLDRNRTLTVDPIVHHSFCTHSLYAAQLTKDAIVDQFRDRFGVRPSVDRQSPDLRISLHLQNNQAQVYLDASGDSLHKRGYRSKTGEAPLNEVLAAGLIALTGWTGTTPLADVMCGSGTIAIEAALLARRIVPGALGRRFGYMRWKDYDESLHRELLIEAKSQELAEAPAPIFASDVDEQMVHLARRNAKSARVAGSIQFSICDLERASAPPGPGTVILNPPYDERMKVGRVAGMYERIGDSLKRRFAGWTAYILTANLEGAKHIGLRASRRIPLRNGALDSRLLRFDLYAGDGSSAEASAGDGGAIDECADVEAPAAVDGAGRAASVGAPSSATAAYRVDWEANIAEFGNRLTRMAKHWKKWARRQGISCFRLYDRDIPHVPLCIDWYEGRLHVSEYDRPSDRSEAEHRVWLRLLMQTASRALDVPVQDVQLKLRRRQSGRDQYSRFDEKNQFFVVHEGGFRFRVNLSDYLDTGLFLDHRQTRAMVKQEAQGKRFLNLFGYTGSFSVYAAGGAAVSTTTVDRSNTYLDWARENMRLNGFEEGVHRFVRADALEFLQTCRRQGSELFDLAVVDPPTFSNSKDEEDWDVQRRHGELLSMLLELTPAGGRIYFSTNFRRFKLDEEALSAAEIREISSRTVPPDFRNKRIHRCWTLTKR